MKRFLRTAFQSWRKKKLTVLVLLLMVVVPSPIPADESSKELSHPYLFFRKGDLPELRERFKTPPQSWYLKILRRKANEKDRAPVQLWAYLLLDKEKYRDRYLNWVKGEWDRQNFDRQWIGFKVCWMAMGYDALYPELTDRQKKNMKRYLQRALAAHRSKMDGWLYNNPSNTVPAQAGAMGMAALALFWESPAVRVTAVQTRKKLLEFAKKAFSPDGGYIEGTLYWNFGVSFYLGFAHADHNTTGNDQLLTVPELSKQYRFAETILGGDGQFMTFNDTQPWLNALPVCLDLGRRYENDLLLWLADRMAGLKAGAVKDPHVYPGNDYTPWVWVMMTQSDPGPARSPNREFPGVPELSVLDRMEWGVMRSSGGSYKPDLVVGVKGSGGTLSHHKQNDLGSFVLYGGGETLLLDPGYYQGGPTEHTLPLIDGEGPGVSGARITRTWTDENWRKVTVKASVGYQRVADRVRRIIVMHRDRGVVVLDDIIPGEGPVDTDSWPRWSPEQKPITSTEEARPITAQYQAAHEARLNRENGGATVVGSEQVLRLWTFGPELNLTVQNREFGNSWMFRKRAKQGRYNWHTIKGEYTSDPDDPLITVLVPGPKKEDPTTAPKYQRDGKTIQVRLPGTEPVRFRKTQDTTKGGDKKEGKWVFVRPDSETSESDQ